MPQWRHDADDSFQIRGTRREISTGCASDAVDLVLIEIVCGEQRLVVCCLGRRASDLRNSVEHIVDATCASKTRNALRRIHC